MQTCDKCHGKGVLNYHLEIDSGVCFPCKGTGKVKGNPPPRFQSQVITKESKQFPGLTIEIEAWHNIRFMFEEKCVALGTYKSPYYDDEFTYPKHCEGTPVMEFVKEYIRKVIAAGKDF
jgi:hypothetical protein